MRELLFDAYDQNVVADTSDDSMPDPPSPNGEFNAYEVSLSHDHDTPITIYNMHTEKDEPFDINVHGMLYVPAFIRMLNPQHSALSTESHISHDAVGPTPVSLRLNSMLSIFQKIIKGLSQQ